MTFLHGLANNSLPPAHRYRPDGPAAWRVPFPPQRIVSLVPSQTELLFDLGLGERVVGVTKFCIHPAGARAKRTVIGGTKNFDFEKIAALRPDLIIGNKEENYQTGIEQLAAKYPVWLSDISNLSEALDMIRRVGFIAGAKDKAPTIAGRDIEASFAALAASRATEARHGGLFHLAQALHGGRHRHFHRRHAAPGRLSPMHLPSSARYPEITAAQLAAAAPQRIFYRRSPTRLAKSTWPNFRLFAPPRKIEIVDGELFSWYGSRLLKSAAYLSSLR